MLTNAIQSLYRIRLVAAMAIAGGLAAGYGLRAADAPVTKEYQLKAAFLYNFTKFVEWPARRFSGPADPIVIGVWNVNPFGAELENVIQGRQANGRAVVVKSVRTVAELTGVHLLFVAAGEEAHVEKLVNALRDAAIVTVGESEKFGAMGGMIVFTQQADKLRFTINQVASEKAGLKLSAQLLKLATDVRK